MASNPITESHNKYIDIWYYAIQDFVTQGKVKLFYFESNKNPADMFTKNLEQVKFYSGSNLVSNSTNILLYMQFILLYHNIFTYIHP